MPHTPRLSIGLVLLSKGCLTDDQLRLATTQSELHGEGVEVALAKLGLVTERQLASARAAQWGYPVLGYDGIGHSAETHIPAALLRAYSAVPLHYSPVSNRLLMGFVYKVQPSLLCSIEQVTGYDADACFITPTMYRQQMEQMSSGLHPEEVTFEEHLSAAEMAQRVFGYAVDIDARAASFAKCRDHVWTRLSGKRRRVDILFRVRDAVDVPSRIDPVKSGERIASLG